MPAKYIPLFTRFQVVDSWDRQVGATATIRLLAGDPSPSCSVLARFQSPQSGGRRFLFATSQCALGRKLPVLRYCAPISRGDDFAAVLPRSTSEHSDPTPAGQRGAGPCLPPVKLVVAVGRYVRRRLASHVRTGAGVSPTRFFSDEKLQYLSS